MSATANTLRLEWDDLADDEAGYRLFRLDPGEDLQNPDHWTQEGGDRAAGTETAEVAGLTSLTTYSFKVQAFNACGPSVLSAPGTYATACPPAPPLPAAPLNCTTERQGDTPAPDPVLVSWTYEGPPVDGFRVSRLDPGEDPEVFAHWDNVGGDLPPEARSYLDHPVVVGRQHWRVRAFVEPVCGERLNGPYCEPEPGRP